MCLRQRDGNGRRRFVRLGQLRLRERQLRVWKRVERLRRSDRSNPVRSVGADDEVALGRLGVAALAATAAVAERPPELEGPLEAVVVVGERAGDDELVQEDPVGIEAGRLDAAEMILGRASGLDGVELLETR